MLHLHHGIAPIIIIDEYDTPIQQGYLKDYYDKVIRFMCNLLSGGAKTIYKYGVAFSGKRLK